MSLDTNTHLRRTAFIALLCLVSTIAIQAQVPAPPPQADQMVRLSVIITDRSGHSVFDVRKEDLQLLVNGTPQTLEYFARDERPLTCGFVIDASGSVRRILPSLLGAAKTIVAGLRPADEAFVARFVGRDNMHFVLGVTSDREAVAAALNDIYVEGGQTAVIDAVDRALKYLDENRATDPSRRRVLVLISDGEDRASRMNDPKALFSVLRNGDVQIFVVGLTKFSSLESPAGKAINLLNGMAEQSGGRAFFPESSSDVPDSARAISHDLLAQFVIGYRAGNKSAAQEPKVQVKWVGQAEAGNRKFIVHQSVVTKPAAQP
jgi:Ca-activated chloride channel family protein